MIGLASKPCLFLYVTFQAIVNPTIETIPKIPLSTTKEELATFV